ncbi:class I SAM-dependent methyltransferase [Aquimarina sp. W85]|uniref:class I SAM-dependent methyltransferase n=1 Tax=Aquimarina rhodophyticola TaxID=3342246 RepID=UPI0036729821
MITVKKYNKMEDVLGEALKDFTSKNSSLQAITVISPGFDDDSIPISYLFRTLDQMPKVEQKALALSYGKVLDVGCGAGSHSLILQDYYKLDVEAIDISAGAIEVSKKRGILKAHQQNLFELQETKFDTIIMLMNGSGIIGQLSNIDRFFEHIKTILNPNGQLLLDSSDLAYLYTDDDGGFWVDATAAYYGEMKYKMKYKNLETDWFDWLYIDYTTLQNAANANGFVCNIIHTGKNNDYLAQIKIA